MGYKLPQNLIGNFVLGFICSIIYLIVHAFQMAFAKAFQFRSVFIDAVLLGNERFVYKITNRHRQLQKSLCPKSCKQQYYSGLFHVIQNK